MSIIIIIISFFLDSIISNLIGLNSIFMPLCTLMSLIIIYPYYKFKNDFLITSFITGVCYDLIYTNTIVVHGFLFLIMAFIIIELNIVLSNNYINVAIMGIVLIIVYRSLTYGFLLITGNISFDILALFKSIYSSVIINVIYVSLAYIITDMISIKLKIRKAN